MLLGKKKQKKKEYLDISFWVYEVYPPCTYKKILLIMSNW